MYTSSKHIEGHDRTYHWYVNPCHDGWFYFRVVKLHKVDLKVLDEKLH